MSDVSSGRVLYPYPWQKEQWQQTLAMYRANRLASGYLVCGQEGVGTLFFAQALAAWLLCQSEHKNGDRACGQCKGCQLMMSGNHPDFLMVEPQAPSHFIKIGQIRALNDFARKTAQLGGLRIIILHPAEVMNVNASNALLKSLEEPGNETLFLLVTERSHDLLPTIRSRCQSLSFGRPDQQQAIDWLSKQVDDIGSVNDLLRLAAGNPLTALAFDKEGVLQSYQRLINDIKKLFKGKTTPAELAKQWEKADVTGILLWLANWMKDVARLSLRCDPSRVQNKDMQAFLGYVAKKSSARSVVEVHDWLLEQRHYLLEGSNLNRLLLLETAFCRYIDLVF
ncbi:DNA polymerase III subunit delta' [invertebrate metagenome]|uniref:DNA polymerase III subunit delta' n=1 Tax=invertebrate metagenome TaxID=1711999 RepID=A0A2H9T9I9_9ZZZZ